MPADENEGRGVGEKGYAPAQDIDGAWKDIILEGGPGTDIDSGREDRSGKKVERPLEKSRRRRGRRRTSGVRGRSRRVSDRKRREEASIATERGRIERGGAAIEGREPEPDRKGGTVKSGGHLCEIAGAGTDRAVAGDRRTAWRGEGDGESLDRGEGS